MSNTSPSPWATRPASEIVREIRDRLVHFYAQTDGSMSFPNSLEGDLLKIVHALIRKLTGEGPAPALRLAKNVTELVRTIETEIANRKLGPEERWKVREQLEQRVAEQIVAELPGLKSFAPDPTSSSSVALALAWIEVDVTNSRACDTAAEALWAADPIMRASFPDPKKVPNSILDSAAAHILAVEVRRLQALPRFDNAIADAAAIIAKHALAT